MKTIYLMRHGETLFNIKGLKEILLGTKEASPISENPDYPYGDYFVKYGGEKI